MHQERCKLSKLIQKELCKQTREWQEENIGKIVKHFKGLKHIARIRHNGKTKRIRAMRTNSGQLMTGPEDIADVFAQFYE
eukprot:10829180-Karenia_brevis.AAC.1